LVIFRPKSSLIPESQFTTFSPQIPLHSPLFSRQMRGASFFQQVFHVSDGLLERDERNLCFEDDQKFLLNFYGYGG
jgi:hypothetical protein